MLTVLVYVCFFLGVFQLAKLPFTLYSALKNPKKFGGATVDGKRNCRVSGRGDNGTDGNNCDSGVSYNYSTNGNSSGIPDIDNVSVTDNRR